MTLKKMNLLILACAVSTIAMAKPLIFATEATYPPFESVAPSGQIVGFDVAVMNAICKQIKVQCQMINQPWESLIPSLKVGKFDAVMGAMAITKKREQQVSFTLPYYQNTVSLVAPNNSKIALSKNGLNDKTVGVQAGTTFANYLHGEYGEVVTVKGYPSEMQPFMDMQAGRLDAVLGDTPLVKKWLKQHSGFKLVGKPIANIKYFGTGDGIAVKKNNTALLKKLNQAIVVLKKNGVLLKLEKHYGLK